MKGEDQILELLAEVLRRQDRTQEQMERIKEEMRDVKTDVQEMKADVQEIKAVQAALLENQQGLQQALRALTTNQQKIQRELQNVVDILDSVARMQRDTNRRLDRLENPNDFV